MSRVVFGAVLIASGLWLLKGEHESFATLNLCFGAFFVYQGWVRLGRQAKTSQGFRAVSDHIDEASDRMKRGETPNQIADAFDRQYQIPPILAIGYIAQDRLRLIGRVRDTPEAQAALAWLASDRQDALPSARDLIGSLDERRNVFGGVGDVHSLAGDSNHPGALLATRAHLYFFAEGHHESFVQETFKETWLQAFPQLHLLHMGTGLAQGVRAELATVSSPVLRKELEERFDLPDSFAIPWRDVTSLGKQPVGSHPPAIEMVIRHGEGSDAKERRFSFGTGFNEEAVDNMIDVARAACALEGRLLMF